MFAYVCICTFYTTFCIQNVSMACLEYTTLIIRHVGNDNCLPKQIRTDTHIYIYLYRWSLCTLALCSVPFYACWRLASGNTYCPSARMHYEQAHFIHLFIQSRATQNKMDFIFHSRKTQWTFQFIHITNFKSWAMHFNVWHPISKSGQCIPYVSV